MFAVNEPIGSFVALSSLDKDLLTRQSIEQGVKDLVDLIKIRVGDMPVDEVAKSLLEHVFDLRLDLVEWLAHNDKGINDYIGALNSHISVNLQLSPYSDLAHAIADILLAHSKIVSPLLDVLAGSFDGVLKVPGSKPTYEMLDVVKRHPSPQIQYLKKWMDASLEFETGIILTDLILTNQIQFSEERIKTELIDFLYDTIYRFGAYSIFTGFWTPDDKDESKITNSMKILAAATSMNHKIIALRTSKKGLFHLVNG